MRKFQFLCGCRKSTHDLKDALKFVKLFDPVLGSPDWTEGEGPLTLAFLRRELQRSQQIVDDLVHRERIGEFITLLTSKPDLGASFHLFAKEVRYTGGDSFSLQFDDQDGLPDAKTLLRAVKIVGPAHAKLVETTNRVALESRVRFVVERFRAKTKRSDIAKGLLNRIWMVDWFKFIDRQTIATMGGLRHVLKMPCYRIEKFEGGVCWQLTEDYFEPDNPQHLAAQRAAMEHLGIWEFTPEPPFQPYPAKPWKRRARRKSS